MEYFLFILQKFSPILAFILVLLIHSPVPPQTSVARAAPAVPGPAGSLGLEEQEELQGGGDLQVLACTAQPLYYRSPAASTACTGFYCTVLSPAASTVGCSIPNTGTEFE